MKKNESQYTNHRFYPGSAKIRQKEKTLDTKARKGEIVPECYLCGTYDDLIEKFGFYICPDCQSENILYDNELED